MSKGKCFICGKKGTLVDYWGVFIRWECEECDVQWGAPEKK